MSLATYFVGLFQSLLGPMLMTITDSLVYGGITSFAASGLILGSAVISLTKSGDHWKQLLIGLGLSGVFLSLLGLSGKLGLIAAAGFLFFSSLPLVNTGAEVLIRKNISNRLQGRAWGLIGLISQLGYLAAYVSAGPLAEGLAAPLFTEGGALAGSIGRLIGLDPSSGIRFIFILSGGFNVLISLMASRNKALQLLSSPSRA